MVKTFSGCVLNICTLYHMIRQNVYCRDTMSIAQNMTCKILAQPLTRCVWLRCGALASHAQLAAAWWSSSQQSEHGQRRRQWQLLASKDWRLVTMSENIHHRNCKTHSALLHHHLLILNFTYLNLCFVFSTILRTTALLGSPGLC